MRCPFSLLDYLHFAGSSSFSLDGLGILLFGLGLYLKLYLLLFVFEGYFLGSINRLMTELAEPVVGDRLGQNVDALEVVPANLTFGIFTFDHLPRQLKQFVVGTDAVFGL